MESLEIILPEEQDIMENGSQMLREEVVKHQGIWKINLSDVDKWPSDPHGDRVDQPEKLNLLNGEVFSKIDRHYIYRLSNKAMRFIYSMIQKSKYDNIKDKLAQQVSLISYL